MTALDASTGPAGTTADGTTGTGLPGLTRSSERAYDVVFDPGETANLVGDADHADVLVELRGRLDAWMAETGDPSRTGVTWAGGSRA